MTASRHHLVSVWDPSRDVDAMQAHLQLLLAAARAHRTGGAEGDDVFVWWGKIRSPNRQQPMAHLADVLALDALLAADDAPEVQLYLTDYRSLYVAHVGEVTADDPREEDDADRYVPAFYHDEVQCDCWFRLFDIRRLVLDDTLGVIAELRKLRNSAYHDRPVSIYGGMVDLPLLVRRDDGARFFDPVARRQYLDGRLWAEWDAERVGLGVVERDLRENMLGDLAWQALDPAARTFVATAERIFRDHRDDPAFDFSPVLVNLAKAMEVQVNMLLGRALGGAPAGTRMANVDGQSRDVATGGPFTIGQLARIIGEDRERNAALGRALGGWFAGSLPAILDELAGVRNAAAHRARTGREEARRVRDRYVGVGCAGVLVELGRVGVR